MVGVGTVLADDPVLSGPRAKGAGARARRDGPARVILDSRLRTPASARMLRTSGGPVLVLAGRGASVARRRRLERAGALVVGVPTRSGRVDLSAAIRELGRRGLATVLIEGGGEVLGAALDAGIGDRVTLFVAPRILGGRMARPAFGGGGAARLVDAARLEEARPRRIGSDWMIEARLRHGRPRRG
jgi:diaminohydroxyphosphoribosylaminopyrimidine deaminase/5-amino-6-(5-phosphoribosylamino)uracil reductase